MLGDEKYYVIAQAWDHFKPEGVTVFHTFEIRKLHDGLPVTVLVDSTRRVSNAEAKAAGDACLQRLLRVLERRREIEENRKLHGVP